MLNALAICRRLEAQETALACSRPAKRGQENPDQHGDDSDDHEQLDEGESTSFFQVRLLQVN